MPILQSIVSSQRKDFRATITVPMENRGKNNIILGSSCSVTILFRYGDILSTTVENKVLWYFIHCFKGLRSSTVTCTSSCFLLTAELLVSILNYVTSNFPFRRPDIAFFPCKNFWTPKTICSLTSAKHLYGPYLSIADGLMDLLGTIRRGHSSPCSVDQVHVQDRMAVTRSSCIWATQLPANTSKTNEHWWSPNEINILLLVPH